MALVHYNDDIKVLQVNLPMWRPSFNLLATAKFCLMHSTVVNSPVQYFTTRPDLSIVQRPVAPRSGFVIAALICLALSGCAGAVKKSPPARVTDQTLTEFNNVGNKAAEDLQRRSRSGSDSRFAVAIDAIILFDRQKTHYFFSDLSKIARDFHEGYIDAAERTELVWKVFSDRGVLLNRHYRNSGGLPLLRLSGEYDLTEKAVKVLRAMYPGADYTLPRLSTVSSRRDGLGNNYVFYDMAVINPPGIAKVGRDIGLDSDNDALVMAVALHESVHHIHRQVMGRGKFRTYREKMPAINSAVEHLGFRFGHWTAVEEFLADAVAIQSGSAAIRFVASRIMRSRDAADKLDASRKRRIDPHDASARLLYLLVYEHQEKQGYRDVTIDTLRARSHTGVDGYGKDWIEYVNSMFDPDFEASVRDAYFEAASRILKIVLGVSPSKPEI